MCTNMLPEDVPTDNWLRDCLHKKIRNSHLLMFDIKQYESWDDGDYRRTYRHLRNVIEKAVARAKEDKHSAARDKYARDYAGNSFTESGARRDSCTKGQTETKGQAQGEG